ARPPAYRGLEAREQVLVHGVADEQGVHVRAVGHVCAAGRRAIEQQRHEALAERSGDLVRKVLDGRLRHWLESPSCTAAREATSASESPETAAAEAPTAPSPTPATPPSPPAPAPPQPEWKPQ